MDAIRRDKQDVRDYYGRVLQNRDDLKASVCCAPDAMPRHLHPHLANVHDEVKNRFYGCGSPLPPVLEGCTVLDLGCGSGRDAYMLSQLVGETGRVIGVDMTDEQLEVARQHQEWHRKRFGYARSNVEFHKGYIEDLRAVGVEDKSIDVVTSNCAINLSPDKESVFSEIFRVLKTGGELVFSDVFAARRVPERFREDQVLLGECLAGAMYMEDFRRLLAGLGYPDHRVAARSRLTLNDPEIEAKLGMIDFHSVTVRTYKLEFEDMCENYGHVAWYKGTIPDHPHRLRLDDRHLFETGVPQTVCGNTARILFQTRLSPHFRVEGNFFVHYGLFPCCTGDVVEDEGDWGCC